MNMHKRFRHRVDGFTDRYPLLGPLVWVLSIQYFVAQLVTAGYWPVPYRWGGNLISDLGNTACGAFGSRYVCSPDHALMNGSFMLLGLTMAVGSFLIYQEFRASRASLLGFSLMGLAGLGTILVGAFPENTVTGLHVLGAVLALLVGNISLAVLALALRGVRPDLRLYTFFSGVLSITAFILFSLHHYAGLGPGGMERLVSYPQTFWLFLFGLYMTHSHYRRSA